MNMYSTDAAEIYKHGGASSNTKIWMDQVNCAASHTRLENCRRSSWGVNDCSHNEDIGIKCFGKYIVNGNWGEWSVWGLCSASCGHATQHRQRLCNSPIPSAGGSDCNGMANQANNCSILKCPVDGDWSEWSSWNPCSATCNGGIQGRTRQCNAPQPSNGGLYCNGTMIISRPCNSIFCESAQQQIKDKSSNSFSAGFVGGVAVGCIVITAVIIFIALLILRRCNPEKVLKRKRNECRNEDLSQLRITSQPNNYECTGRSIGTQSGVYDTCCNTEVATAHTQCNTDTIDSGAYSNSQFNADSNEELYENLKVQ
ncbi:netrin receptor unc-5 [Mytilus galloprovincialis]|uniref:Netrin receptor unc-5 n=1 Tax=Mytilus galloprovincialis TaxID=29158 RepID=A0A8B6HJU3_MYTGA|nr:netrin receptor unc-5 [Mytilus galloprovincialis]